MLSLNIQSLPTKFSECSEFIYDLAAVGNKPDVICLQEIWQVPDPTIFNLNDYNTLELNARNSAKGGGVGIYVRNGLSFNILKPFTLSIERIFESIFIEIVTPSNQKIVIGSIYRPGTKYPGLTFTEQFSEFSDTLSATLSDLGSKHENIFLYGDFNLDILKFEENKFISSYIDTLFSFGFLQIVTKPTRVSENSATLIDHILTNSTCSSHNSFIICSRISDHFPILHYTNLSKPKLQNNVNLTRNLSETNVNRFKAALNSYGWQHVMEEVTCPQAAYNNFINTFNSLFDTFFPLNTHSPNRNIHKIEPWMTSGLLTSRRRKNQLCSISLKKPTATNICIYKQYRNLYNKIVRNAKKSIFTTN